VSGWSADVSGHNWTRGCHTDATFVCDIVVVRFLFARWLQRRAYTDNEDALDGANIEFDINVRR
jgi:hypothetical protein